MRFGIFGGSFDPIHLGHLTLADCCLEQAGLDELWFVPAAGQPLKPRGPRAAGAHRVAMIRGAVEGRDKYRVSTREIDRGGISYTAETLEGIQEEHPQAELFFPMGADSLVDLPRWYRAADVCRLATPLIVHRAGAAEPDFEPLSAVVSRDRLDVIRQSQIEMPVTPISSTKIRQLIVEGGGWEELVPPQVAEYIRRHDLYRDGR